MPELRVRFSTGPCSAGTVNTSPRAWKTARLPVGEGAASRISSATDSVRGLSVVRSVTTWIGDFARLLGREVQQVEAAARLEHDVLRADGRERDVEVGELRHLAHARRSCRGPRCWRAGWRRDRRGSRACRRATSGARRWRRSSVTLADGLGRQVERPDVGRPAAAIALPGAERLRLRQVGDLLAVGREGGELAVRDRQLLGRPARGGDQVELVVALPAALAATTRTAPACRRGASRARDRSSGATSGATDRRPAPAPCRRRCCRRSWRE